MLDYREFDPVPALAAHVRCFWTLRSDRGEMPQQRILPDGSFDIVFHFGDPFLQNGQPQPAAIFVGEIRRPVVVVPSGRGDVLGIRFHPGGVARFLAMPASEICDLVLPLEEVLGDVMAPVFGTTDTASRIGLLERALIRRLRPADRRLDAAVHLITCSSGAARIRDVAASVGATERTLERLFDSGVGMGPKAFARIARFQASLRGDDSGYFDDSHRIRDFRELSGVTPAQLAREQNEMNDHFVGNVQDQAAAAR
ncbi:MAG TPA: DUF6597 domain-containing transcriptional factor [Thermoanaerobaculia bacterium]|nr:DUF6597 domain-containing transcriptional factor [Thermoanaerobaculia bacterium]